MKLKRDFGTVEVIKETDGYGIYIMIFFPNKESKTHFHKKGKEIVIVAEGELIVNGKLFKKGEMFINEINQPHKYVNKTDKNVKLVYINMPKFDEKDVFEVDE